VKSITWNPDKLKVLRDGYDRARRAAKLNTDSFTIEIDGKPHSFTVGYAQHLVEYLEDEFARNPDQPRRPNNEGEEGQ